MSVTAVLATLVSIYAIAAGIFLISENRRPQATLAWMMAFYFAPVIGVVIYVLFGRDQKAFAKQDRLLRQNMEGYTESLLSRQDAVIAAVEKRGAGHRKLMTLVKETAQSVLTGRNEVVIQQDAETFYASLERDLKAAEHSIHLQYYIWRSDEYTERLKDILADKAAEGVHVRLLYDPLGSFFGLRRSYIRAMRRAGVRMVPTSALHWLHTISYRNHRKITVIDGTIGYTGGMNIGQEHLDGGKGYASWRDTQLRLVGEGAAALQSVFMVDWYNAAKENLFSDAYFPENETLSSETDLPVQILTSGPDSAWEAIRQLYALMIATAERHVFLQSPYFILDVSVAEALRTAALAGTDVKVMLSAPGPIDRVAGWAANTFIKEIADAGAQVFLYEKGYLHAKTISLDSEICSIGSANMDIRSFSINYELNAVMYDADLAARLEADFERDLAGCRAFEPDAYQAQSSVIRFRDSVARLFSPLL